MSEPVQKIHRIMSIVEYLAGRGPVARSRIAEALNLDARLVLSDLKEIEEHGRVRRVGEGRQQQWESICAPPAPRAIHDKIAMRLGREVLVFLEGTAFTEVYERFGDGPDVGRLGENLDRKFVHLQEPARSYQAQTEVLDTILDGLLRGRVLTVRYRVKGDETAHRIRPLTLVVYRRALYLLALGTGENVERLPVDRITDATAGEPFEYPADWDPHAELAPYFGIYKSGSPERIVLRFAAAKADLVRARKWHPTQTQSDLPDGRVQVVMRAGGLELVRFVLEWGPHCEVVGPTWLREAVITELRGALDQYGSGAQEPLALARRTHTTPTAPNDPANDDE